ncbi:hypothetical protein HNR10_002586 [Nocardiopsis aegyptia]|uniref:Secreted protein n=2 Tax=Nocardiopsis aegyptia TaxID=220378 RepID=A0A7Z0ENZ0_9ACTN|nr:hypothetical protein [Nocardiopsis aegyptia]
MTSPPTHQTRPPAAQAPAAAGGRIARSRRRLRTTPARLWLLSAMSVAAIVALFGSATFTLNQARDGLNVLGHNAGPQAMATTQLYLALADMDARMADVLLMGTDHDLGSGREDALEHYEESRARANEALLQAASLTEGDTVEERNVQAVLDGMGTYEQLATEARLTNDEAGAPPGEVDEEALATYRAATRLMHTELLPKAFNLGLDSSAIVRANHEEGQESVAIGLVWVGVVGVAAVASLVALQLYLRVRFRRRFNVLLIAATAGTVVLTVGVVLALNTSGGHQSRAKEEGLDAAMALARAGAIATDMQADQSRYLADPGRADNYQQTYLDRAQAVLFRPATNLDDYYEQIDGVTESYPDLPGSDGSDEEDPGTLGYLGQRAQDALLSGQEDALADVLAAYAAIQDRDRAMRAAAEEGDTAAALDERMGIAHSEDGVFQEYVDALNELTRLHQEAFTEGIDRGDRALAPWSWALPVGTLVLLALVVAGVRPRLAEYR